MPFVKLQKNNAYFMRFQVKFRRRREGKTDYYARKRLTTQDKNKFATPKWRFVVRRTCTRIICQVVSSTIKGDIVRCQADSTELKKFGLTAGLTNYASAYATGLLCARRLLKDIDEKNKKKEITDKEMSNTFNFVPESTGEYINIQKTAETKNIEHRPFQCFLDIGIVTSSKGNRVFAAMKGAVDGGIHIPHKDTIFPKPKDPKCKDNLLRARIFGEHVQKYFDALKNKKDKDDGLTKKEHDERFKRQFSLWEKCLKDTKCNKIDDLYKKVHQEIRANPTHIKKQAKEIHHPKNTNVLIFHRKPNPKKPDQSTEVHFKRDRRLKNEQRKVRVQEKIQKWAAARKNK